MNNSNETDYARDLAITTTYIFSEIFESPKFMSHIDKAITLAEEFINKFPPGTDWGKQDQDWESALYEFANK